MGRHHKHEKKHKKHKEKRRKHRSSSSESSENEEWVEKPNVKNDNTNITKSQGNSSETAKQNVDTEGSHEEWMSLKTEFSSISHLDRRQEKICTKQLERDSKLYNPRTYTKELNPYWKDGGDGLPKFKKPTDNEMYTMSKPSTSLHMEKPSQSLGDSKSNNEGKTKLILTNDEINTLASKIVKAEVMGNTTLASKLKLQLEEARQQRLEGTSDVEHVLLTQSDSLGRVRPLKHTNPRSENSSRSKKQKVESHQDGQRIRYFADDDKYNIHQMFENEKFNASSSAQNSEFLKMSRSIRKNDNLDDIFTEGVRRELTDEQKDAQMKQKAISEHHKMNRTLDGCRRCLQSKSMLKHLMVSIGETVYLSLPNFEPLTDGHCQLIPLRHTSCATQLDENEWSELLNFRKALTRMFHENSEEVIFFETAMFLNHYPHMVIECIPMPKSEADLAPIYFKKAIDESEYEWAHNKKLVSMKGKDVRRTVPKGLPYFSVSFGMDEGYAHVIEEEKNFPSNFAQEIIGGMLDLHHSKWRKPKPTNFEEQNTRVKSFSKRWSKFDCVSNMV